MLFLCNKNELANINMGMQEMSHFLQSQMKSELKSLSHLAGGKFNLCLYRNFLPALHRAMWWSWGPNVEQMILKGLFFSPHSSLPVGVDSEPFSSKLCEGSGPAQHGFSPQP